MNKEFNLDTFKMGYIIAYMSDGSFFSNRIVERQMKEGFSAEASQITHIEVSGGERHAVNIGLPVSKCIDITKKHKGRYIYLLRYDNEDYEKRGRYKVAYFSATLSNLAYDIAGILRFLYKSIKQFNKFYFCSEGAAWALQKVYPKALKSMKPEDVMPAHFLAFCSEFEIVWKGYIPK